MSLLAWPTARCSSHRQMTEDVAAREFRAAIAPAARSEPGLEKRRFGGKTLPAAASLCDIQV